MRQLFPICVSIFLVSCSAQVTTDHAPGLDSLKFQREAEPVDTVSHEYLCKGTEPFWLLKISKKENLIDLYDPMTQDTTHFPFSEPKSNEGVLQFRSTGKNGEVVIELKKESCSDGMSEKKYDFSVEISLGEKKLKGCGEVGH